MGERTMSGLRETRCEGRDAVGQQCLRPTGHSPTYPGGWFTDFTDGSSMHGHDFGGVSSDSRSSAEWRSATAHQLTGVGHESWSGYWWGSCTCGKWRTPGEPGFWGPLSQADVDKFFARHLAEVQR